MTEPTAVSSAARGAAQEAGPAADLPPEVLESIEQSFVSLFRVVKNGHRIAAAALDPELQPAAWHVLRQIIRESPVQAGALAATTGMDKSAISRHIKELRERGLVETEHGVEDARAVLVRPTDYAVDRVVQIRERTKRGYRRGFSGWDEDELREFARLLEQFVHNAEWDTDLS